MNKKQFSKNLKESNTCIAIDPKLWDRLVWKKALEKAIKKNGDKLTQVNLSNLIQQWI